MILFISQGLGFVIVIVVIAIICLACYLIRRHFKIGTFTKEEESQMKSNLDMLLEKEEIPEQKEEKKDE